MEIETPPLAEEPESKLALRDKVNQVTVLKILALMVNERKTAKEACAILDVPLSTYYQWQKSGVTLAAYTELVSQITELTFQIILPDFKQMVETLVAIAKGVPPDHNPRMKVDANHAIAAWDRILKLIPVMPMDQAGAGTKAADHLSGYMPKQVNLLPGGTPGTNFTQINQYLFTNVNEPGLAPEDWVDQPSPPESLEDDGVLPGDDAMDESP